MASHKRLKHALANLAGHWPARLSL